MAGSKKSEQLSNNNLIIVMVLITLVVVGVSGLIAKSLITSVIRDTKVISAKSKANNQLKTDLMAAPQLVDSFNALGSTANTLNDALPTSVDLPSLIVTVENMGNDAGVTVKSISPSQAVGTSPTIGTAPGAAPGTVPGVGASSSTGSIPMVTPQTYDFVIDFDGTYPGLQKLLGDIETSARPMRVIGLQLSGTGSSMSGEIDAETYWQDKAQLPFGTETIK